MLPSDTLAAALVLGGTAFGLSLLTLFTGFGLGTVLMPTFALFFPVHVAVASTAVVHGANNLFKTSLLGKHARRSVVLRFGIPAVVAAFVGAGVLTTLSDRPIGTWSVLGVRAEITPVKLVMGLLVLVFALLELVPRLRSLRAPIGWLPVGGALSGFFGGLSGHQGALRAAFLSPIGLSTREFAATQAVLGLLVDTARLAVYGWALAWIGDRPGAPEIPWGVVGFATLCAFGGALVGKRLLTGVTLRALHVLTGIMLLAVGLALATGLT